MWFFGIKKRNLTSISDELRKACSDMRERLCADRLDQGFVASYSVTYDPNGTYTMTTTGGDGLALFTASHTREDGGTNNNNVIYDGTTYGMDFEYDSLKAAHRTAALIKDPRGKPMNINLDTLVVTRGYTNAFRAKEILRTLQKGNQPSTADRESGGVPDFKIIELPPFTTNTDYWFMFDSSMKNQKYGLQYLESQPISLDGPNVVFRTEELQYRSTLMCSFGQLLRPKKKLLNSVNLRVIKKLGQYRANIQKIVEGVTTKQELSFV